MSSGCRTVNQKGSSKLVLRTRRASEDETNSQVFWGEACAVHIVVGRRVRVLGCRDGSLPVAICKSGLNLTLCVFPL